MDNKVDLPEPLAPATPTASPAVSVRQMCIRDRRNALEMLGVVLVPGVTGPAEEAAAKFLVGEKQGDPGILEICREEDPDDPMACMHDCSKCAGCGPIRVPEEAKKNLPDVH